MKSAILAILFPFAAVAAALTPDTIKDDIPGTATVSEIVTAGGSARPADVHRIVDTSFRGGTQEVNRVTGAFDSKANKTDISADNPAFSNAVNAVVENKANKSEVDALANSAVVTNALTVATTNRVALLESSKADKTALDTHVTNTNNPHAVTAEQIWAVPLVEDSDGNKTAVTIGSRVSGVPVGEGSLANGSGVSAYGLGSHAEGINTVASGKYSHTYGVNTFAQADYSYAGGVHAGTKIGDDYAFAWNGDSTKDYTSNGQGTFNINPAGGLDGFYIGEQTLALILSNKLDKAYNVAVLTNGTLRTNGGEPITPAHIGAATAKEVQEVRVTATNANTVATNAYTLARDAIPSKAPYGYDTYATWDGGTLYVRTPYSGYYSYIGPGDIGLYGYDPNYGYTRDISFYDLHSQIYSIGNEVSNMYSYFPSYSEVDSMVYSYINASDYHFRSQVEEVAPIDASNPIFANQVMAVGTGFDPHVIEEINELTRRGSFSSNCWIVVDNYFQNNNIVKAVLKERTGKEQDRGTGWGYMLYDWTTDDRSWLLYVPELSATMTCTEPSADKVISLPGTNGTPVNVTLEGFKGNPLVSDVFELGELAAEVVYTEGKEGTNGCHSATYELSAVHRDGGNDAFHVIVTNVTHGVAPYAISASFDATNQSYVVEYDGHVTVGPSVGGTYHAVATVSEISVTTSEGKAVLSYSLSTDVTVTSEAVQDGSQATEVVTSPHVTVSTTHDDTRLVATAMPAVRMATVVSAHLYWDPVLKRTWKIDVANGCFYSRVVSEKNLTIKEQ